MIYDSIDKKIGDNAQQTQARRALGQIVNRHETFISIREEVENEDISIVDKRRAKEVIKNFSSYEELTKSLK